MLFNVEFSSTVRSTTCWLNTRQKSKYLVMCLMVIVLAQGMAGRWTIHSSCGQSGQEVSLDGSCASGLCARSIMQLAAARHGVTVIFEILYDSMRRLVHF